MKFLTALLLLAAAPLAVADDLEDVPLRLRDRRDELRSAAHQRRLFEHREPGDVRGAAHLRLPRAPAQAQAERGRGDARGERRRHHLHPAHQAGHLLRGRSGVRGEEARAGGGGLRLRDEARARSERARVADRGARALRRRAPRQAAAKARKTGKFDYDAPIEGLKVVDRYTFQVKIKKPLYVFIYNFADCRIACAVAREVVENYGDDIGVAPRGHGTLPPRVLEAQLEDGVRAQPRLTARIAATPSRPPDDPRAAGDPSAMRKGKRLPMIDRVEVSIIEETQPRWLSFLNEEMDLIFLVPEEFAYQAFPNNKLAKNLERRGIRMEQLPRSTSPTLLQHGGSGGRRLHAGEGRAAPRDLPLVQDQGRDRDPAQGPGDRGGGALRARASPATTRTSTPPPTSTTRRRPRRCSTCSATWTATATATARCPTARRSCCIAHSTPSSRDQQFDELWKRGLDDIGIRLEMVKEKWPDIAQEGARRARCSSGSWATRRRSPTRTPGSPRSTARTPSRTSARFQLQRYDGSTSRRASCPTAPSARSSTRR